MIRMLGAGWVDVGVADHELFEDVVLDRPGQQTSISTPCSSAATIKKAMMGMHGAVHGHTETDILSSGMLVEEDIFMSSTVSMATPAMPTSPVTRG